MTLPTLGSGEYGGEHGAADLEAEDRSEYILATKA